MCWAEPTQIMNGWVFYVGGDRIGVRETKDGAEEAALDWMRANPQTDDQ